MIQLHVLSGARAGQRVEAKIFPIVAGRDQGCALTLHDAGVFSRHFEIHFSPEGFLLVPVGEAVVTVNGASAANQLLRSGDVITAGYARVQFWLGAMPQRGLKIREALTWLLIAAVAAAQVYLLWRLLAMARS